MNNTFFSIIRLCICLLLISNFQNAMANTKSSDQLLDEAMIEFMNTSSGRSTLNRRLRVIIEQDPTHPQTQWQLVFRHFDLSQSMYAEKIADRTEIFASAGSAIHEIVKNANERNNPAFGHYVLARYASLYYAFDQATKEIDLALTDEPKNPRFLKIKAWILIRQAQWENNDELLTESIQILETILKLVEKSPTLFARPEDIYSDLGYASELLDTDRQRTVDYYLTQFKYEKNSHYVLHCISRAYQIAGDCGNALKSAEKAQSIRDSKYGRKLLRYAQFCQETENISAQQQN